MTAPFHNQGRQFYLINPEDIATAIGSTGSQNKLIPPIGFVPVSQLATLHDGKILNRDLPELYEVVGTGTGTYEDNNKYKMEVAAGEWLVRRSKHVFPYFSGKPQKAEMTCDNMIPVIDVVKRKGYFSSSTASPHTANFDGFYLESNGAEGIKFVVANNGTVIHEALLADWTGYEYLAEYQDVATWDNFTVAEVNFLWLGGAYIELKLATSAGFVTAHQYIHAGTQKDVFMQYPNHPVRYEIRSSGGVGTFRAICNQVATGGSINESGLGRTLDTGITPLVLSTIGTIYPILGIRKKTTHANNPVLVNVADVAVASNDRVKWSLLVNPTISGAGLSFSDVDTTVVQKSLGDGTLTVTDIGYEIATGYLSIGEAIPTGVFTSNYLMWLSGNIDGTQDAMVLAVTPQTTNASVNGVIDFEEG